ncbi:MAG TPA: GNAT family N-acetyltransferase [Rhodoblastus sp.]|nr:GNAT family N-acetyltransferase [Rhodoblastus sp.]
MAILETRRAGEFDVDACGDLASMRDDWAALEAAGRFTPFQTRAWLEPWYAIVAPHFGASPLIVRVRDRLSGAPLMLLPLARRRESGLALVEFADLGVSDYHAPLFAPEMSELRGQAPALWTRIQAALRPADLFRFEKVPPLVGGLRNPLLDIARRRMNFSAWEVALPADRGVFDAGLAGQSFLRELARKNRRIAGRGQVRFAEARTPAELRRAFETLCDQRAARFAELGRDNILQRAPFRAFYEQVALAAQDRVGRLFTLCVDDEIVATVFGLARNGRFCMIMSTIGDERWKSSSPGNVAMDRLVSHLIGEGGGVLDFTIGDEAYKRSFGAVERPLSAGVASLSWRGSPRLVADFARKIRGRRDATTSGTAVLRTR